MSEQALTADRILDTAEEVIRRFGPAKATVVDVARALGVSHGSVYRHFASKAALRDAVTRRWLDRLCAPLAEVTADAGPADGRLHRWLATLMAAKHGRALDDPELFATYMTLVMDARQVVDEHVAHLVDQIARIIGDGVEQGVFRVDDVPSAARAVLDATARFHNPAHAADWSDPSIGRAFEAVWGLLVRGLRR